MPQVRGRQAVIIGAGPAGLTAAYELLTRTDIRPVVIEKSDHLGGLARTVNYKGNRIDFGGHRFFSKSDRVMKWWLDMLPLQGSLNGPASIQYHRMEREVATNGHGPDPLAEDRVMLLRPRKSRIYYLRRFFDYPIRLDQRTISNLGMWRILKIGASYCRSSLFPIRPERTLEDFLVNRFGRELYQTFFQSYTEKVWGVPCSRISAEWGVQRIKGLSIPAALMQAAKKMFQASNGSGLAQKGTETSLIERFLYPKYGPGQMWEEVGRRVRELGGEIRMGCELRAVDTEGSRVARVHIADCAGGATDTLDGDYFFSTAPIRELLQGFRPLPPQPVLEVSDGLLYRDFIIVGLLLPKLKLRDESGAGGLIADNWIYIQEPGVQIGRLQIFNNWSPFMVADPGKVWLGVEYFCNQSDPLWTYSEAQMVKLATEELARIGIIDPNDVLDSKVLRAEKAYPSYFGSFDRFSTIREFVDRFENLFLVGRNGMHRYNNQDHSMLTAMLAVENIIAGRVSKENLWDVNTEMDYHESRRGKAECSRR